LSFPKNKSIQLLYEHSSAVS